MYSGKDHQALLATVDRWPGADRDGVAGDPWQLVRPGVETTLSQVHVFGAATAAIVVLCIVAMSSSLRLPAVVRYLLPLSFLIYILGGFYPLSGAVP